jgi:hypothetical protein
MRRPFSLAWGEIALPIYDDFDPAFDNGESVRPACDQRAIGIYREQRDFGLERRPKRFDFGQAASP